MEQKHEIAVFGGGCFWCTEAIFKHLRGVSSVMPGYSGGRVPNPTYEQVSSGTTGHAEATRVEYDPALIKYETLLDVFFAEHDPTTPNRQGDDVGEQYRSVVFYATEAQKAAAEHYVKQLEADRVFKDPIVTAIEPLRNFYEAEDYHRNYYETHRGQPYCRYVIDPKIRKLREKFAHLLT
ncbi:MAG TPA: peptide-methionine (S)-S-oxide reductase MsrA [Patescibacteria group bacterium]|nr:peptide-methionine (S)-S-oxide reductase MsrA [Patescibacteria group bacterium]